MKTEEFNYNLPESLIAQKPSDKRGASRMLILDRENQEIKLEYFANISNYLAEGDCVVFNNTKVINARMFGRKEAKDGQGIGAKIEALLICPLADSQWQCFLKPGKRVKVGTIVYLLNIADELSEKYYYYEVIEKKLDGTYIIKFNMPDVLAIQDTHGHIPLPPYIKRSDTSFDKDRYQTVYAKEYGAVAAPTAGLHFTKEILDDFIKKGINTAEVTLHVGPGTFLPVSVDTITDHKMHSEDFIISAKCAELINETRTKGKRVIAIGTTAVRVLETCSDSEGIIYPKTGSTDIFIYPPYTPKITDGLLTNFHLPKSTLLMLISAFAGQEFVMEAYQKAIDNEYKFYSYGDCMLIV